MKKGFTLVELIATLVVLSVVAIIVVPNIYKSITEVQEGIYNTQLEAIKSATKNWVTDNIDSLPSVDGEVTYVFLKDLIGYIGEVKLIEIDEETYERQIVVYKDNEGNTFNDNIFILITCNVVEESENNSSNYKYSYEVYDTNEKHLSYLAQLYAQKNNVTSKTTVTLSDLISLANSNLVVESKLKNIEDGTLISNASVVINYSNGSYKYDVTLGS